MGNTIDVPANALTETLLTGNVTLNLVGLIFSCLVVGITVTLWVVYKFQTKEDAIKAEARLEKALSDESKVQKDALEEAKTAFTTAIANIDKHMTAMKNENKDDVRQMQAEISGVRTVLTTVSNDLGFLRGKAER